MKVKREQSLIYLVFPGIGLDYRLLMEKYEMSCDIYSDYFYRAKEKVGIDLELYMQREPVVDEPFYSWCLTYTIDYILYQEIIKKGINPQCLLGYSMGLTTALACSNAITYEDGLKLLHISRNLRTTKKKEAMLALIGWDKETLLNFLNEFDYKDSVFIACENNHCCFVLSGLKESLEVIYRKANEDGIYKSRWIEADRAFHSLFYTECEEENKMQVGKININLPERKVFSVIDQTFLESTEDICHELVRNLSSKMLWEDSIHKLIQLTKEDERKRFFVEISLDDTLSKTSKLIDLESKFINYRKFLKLIEDGKVTL